MDSPNIMKVNKYIPKTPGGPNGTGYDNDSISYPRKAIGPFTDVQTMDDFDSENFKYGFKYTASDRNIDPNYLFQDPLFAAFDIILDTDNSPLFITDEGSAKYKNSLASFLLDYGSISSIASRQQIHDQFLKTLFVLFNTEFKSVERNKAYYINSIAGLEKITARIVEFEKDKITIVLNEDVSMIAGYLAQLYNNLSYSYRDQRQMAPANLLRFNMYIKVHDVRNMMYYVPTGNTSVTYFDQSYIIYFLRDCTFDFRKTKNFDDTITIGGFDASVPNKPSTISIDVFYKSIEVESEFPLIMDTLTNGSTAIKLNNKDNEILGYASGGLNDVYINNTKSVDAFYDDLKSSSKINNDGKPAVNSNANATSGATDNYQGGIVSSDRGTSKTRADDIYDVPVINTDLKGNEVFLSDLQDKRADKIYSDPPVINTDSKGNEVFSSDTNDKRFNVINNLPFPYDASVFESDWYTPADKSFQQPQTGPALTNWRDSILGQININSFLNGLPFNIINMFFGGYHGMQTMYIDNTSGGPSAPINIDPPSINRPSLGVAPTPISPKDPPVIGPAVPNPDSPKDEPSIAPAVPNPVAPDNGPVSPSTPKPVAPDNGPVSPSTPKPVAPDNGPVSPSTPNPTDPGAHIDTTVKPHIVSMGALDNTAIPHPPVSGVIDTTARPHPPVSGVIDTSIKTQVPLSGVIDTTARPRIYGDLGVLYVGITANNILPVTYLYSGVNAFHSLVNYYVYNNAVTESKPLNNIKVDQTLREIAPFELVYEYNNNVDIQKTLDNITLYNNNIERSNNLSVISIDNTVPIKPEFPTIQYDNTGAKKVFETVYLYGSESINNSLDNVRSYNNDVNGEKVLNGQYITTEEKLPILVNLGNVVTTTVTPEIKINLGSLSQPSVLKKTLEPYKLYTPVEKKTIELGKISTTEKQQSNLLVTKEVSTETVVVTKKEFEPVSIEQKIIQEVPFEKEYIKIDEIKPEKSLNGDTIFTEVKKENTGLNNEKLR